MTFARFVAVPENRSALVAVQRIAACLGSGSRRPPPPVYLHGPTGTGKTHLVSALVEEVTRRRPGLVVTVAGDLDLLAQSPGRSADGDFLQIAGQSDLVIVEDLQHVRPRSVEAWVQTFDALRARRVAQVYTASVGPRWLEAPTRLRSRLASGLVVGIEPLQPASRLALLQDKAQRRQLAVSRPVLAWLAEHLTGGGRQLEGALATLEALARLPGKALDVPTVAEHFRGQVEAGRPTVERITQRVCCCFDVQPRQLQSSQRSRDVLLPRQVGMYLARKLTALSLEQIGSHFGGRDHSTVLHACRKVEQALTHDPVLGGTVRQLHSELA